MSVSPLRSSIDVLTFHPARGYTFVCCIRTSASLLVADSNETKGPGASVCEGVISWVVLFF